MLSIVFTGFHDELEIAVAKWQGDSHRAIRKRPVVVHIFEVVLAVPM